jgi:hypothetical protein
MTPEEITPEQALDLQSAARHDVHPDDELTIARVHAEARREVNRWCGDVVTHLLDATDEAGLVLGGIRIDALDQGEEIRTFAYAPFTMRRATEGEVLALFAHAGLTPTEATSDDEQAAWYRGTGTLKDITYRVAIHAGQHCQPEAPRVRYWTVQGAVDHLIAQGYPGPDVAAAVDSLIASGLIVTTAGPTILIDLELSVVRAQLARSEVYVTPGHPTRNGAGYDCGCGECRAHR